MNISTNTDKPPDAKERIQSILYMVSSIHLMTSSVAYSYVALYSCLTDGFDFNSSGTLLGNILYIFGYLVYIIGEYIQLRIRSMEEQPLLDSITRGGAGKSTHVSRMFRASSGIFAFSAMIYTVMSVSTCYISGWNQSNIGTLVGNAIYTIGCIIYSCAEYVYAKDARTLLMTRSAMPILQHIEF